ncbi:MAG: hypothetical protein FJ275_09320, partial [Planctomycetes bacterium]|nr:hypothetical protein [Planctomycetota bacterium]
DGNDTIYGTAGKDWISGGFDSDYVESGAGDDDLFGGPGGDCRIAAGGNARIFGGHGNDVIDGGDGINTIEGGPGDDRIYGRGGADTIYGGTTSIGYAFLQADLATGRPVIAAIHGGFTAVTADGSCGPEVMFHPEVYPDASCTLQATIYDDRDADGIRDPGEIEVTSTTSWTVRIVDATTYADVMVATIMGGKVALPTTSGLPAGSYYLVVDAVPAGWVPSNAWSSMTALVTLGGASPSAPPDLAFHKAGQVAGKVMTKSGTQTTPAGGVSVYLDRDRDGSWDAGEPVAVTGTNGGYVFDGLAPGSYRVAVADTGVCAHVSPDYRDAVVTSGSTSSLNFEITATLAPVVDGVLLAKPGVAVTWTPVPDGAAQLDPIAGTFSLIAIETCISTGSVATVTNGGTLRPVTSTGALGTPIKLALLGVDPTQPNRIIYQVGGPTFGTNLAPGRYRFTVSEASVQSNTGATLDGEWINPGPTAADGSHFPSGNASAGGDFVFDFVIAGSQGLSGQGLDGGTVVAIGAAAATGTVEGTVWRHDTADADQGRTASEPGLAGMLVRLVNAQGVTVATTTTAPLDLDGDGTIDAGEQGAFRFQAVAAGTYTVAQTPAYPWVQATAGGASAPDTLYAVSFTASSGTSSLWTIDTARLKGTNVVDFPSVAARDVAFTSRDVAWIAGTSVS